MTHPDPTLFGHDPWWLIVTKSIAIFVFLPYYPIWSLLVIALDVFVIWALCLYNRDAASDVAAERR